MESLDMTRFPAAWNAFCDAFTIFATTRRAC